MEFAFQLVRPHRALKFLPGLMVVFVLFLLWRHGPIQQFDHYHEFADQAYWLGISHARDVFSNFAFLLVGLWGLQQFMYHWSSVKDHRRPALLSFIFSIIATAWCSSYYHLAPDDVRLFWDRLPIATACASLIVLMRPTIKMSLPTAWSELLLALILAVLSVWWWQYSSDLRAYLVLQIFAILLPPLWQYLGQAPQHERMSFGLAIGLYVLAKVFELADVAILDAIGVISGHSLKHLLAALAAYFIVCPWIHPWRRRLLPLQ